MEEITQFDLPVNAYASFDAQSMRDLIIDRLNNNSDIGFTDQNYEGSNLNAIIDIIGYSFHTLMFYLNQTSSEAVFTDTQLYENMNRIVKLIDYKPVGRQTAVANMDIRGTNSLTLGYYTLPRFSFISSNGKTYSVPRDITFRKTTNGTEIMQPIDNTLFYEGRFQEYPSATAVGENSEVINLLPGPGVNIDHFSIFVFVKEIKSNKWYEYKRVPSLFLSDSNDRSFECRYNQNKNYEIKFGNNINGKKLTSGDSIAIYYISSAGQTGKITKNHFNQTSINIYNTTRFDEIFSQIKDTSLNYIDIANSVNINASNTEDSTDYDTEETVEDIRTNAPKFFSSEYKLITKPDYENFVRRNFKNLIYDVKVSNNSDYLNTFRKYITTELGLNSFTDHSNALFNQYTFSDSFNFNNIFFTIVPKFKKDNTVVTRSNYISPALKNEIIQEIRKYKLLNSEVTFLDPVYLVVDFVLKSSTENNIVQNKDYTSLVIERNTTSIINDNTMIDKVYNIINNYFNTAKLGQVIDVKKLNADILGVEGVVGFYTYREDLDLKANGLSLGIYNPIYNGRDLKIFDSNMQLKYFQIPYIENQASIKNRIKVEAVTKSSVVTEY